MPSGEKQIRASWRLCEVTATHVTRFADCRNGSTTPAMSKISRVRGKIASAFECSDCDGRASMSRHLRPRRAHSLARKRPTGPAPTISTSVSVVWESKRVYSPQPSVADMSELLCVLLDSPSPRNLKITTARSASSWRHVRHTSAPNAVLQSSPSLNSPSPVSSALPSRQVHARPEQP